MTATNRYRPARPMVRKKKTARGDAWLANFAKRLQEILDLPVTPTQLKPGQLCRILNSTPLGQIITPAQLNRDRAAAGYRIGNGQTIDLFRYAAWLFGERRRWKRKDKGDPYAKIKERARARSAAISQAGRDIGPLPRVKKPHRKRRARRDFAYFCRAYFPRAFARPWSEDHRTVLRKIERAAMEGGLFAHAMPRGSGKTTICMAAVLWAVLFGHRRFVVLVASSTERARALLSAIKTWIETNPFLADDFPEAIYPVRQLDRIANRQHGQLYRGRPTRIEWTADKITFATIPRSRASGSVIAIAGMRSAELRGQNHSLADGTVIRPEMAVIDDPQTRESALSPSQCEQREAILLGDVLGMSGPGQKITAVLCCTVIRRGDLADRLLDRRQHPLWQGERTKLIYSFPANEELWNQYARLQSDSFAAGGQGEEATEFYRQHRDEMDAGARVAWPARHYPDELSAIQHAMNLRLRDEAAFWAECQNEPLSLEDDAAELLTADQIAAKINRRPRREMPAECQQLTAMIDVHEKILFFVVVAWGEDFSGYILDYGTWPKQSSPHFALRNARTTLARRSPGAGLEGAIYHGLEVLTEELLGRDWPTEDGGMRRIDRCLIDCGWGQMAGLVRQFCRQSAHAGALLPSIGKYIGASGRPMSEWSRKRGERIGYNWRVSPGRDRHVLFDANFWKSFVHARLATAMGDRGCLSIFGRQSARHRLLADHLTAERPVPTEAGGRLVDEWKARPGRPDNHWLDCLVGCAVAASMHGCRLGGQIAARRPARPRVKLSDLQRKKRYART